LPTEFIENCRIATLNYRLHRIQLTLSYRSDLSVSTPLNIRCDGQVLLDETVTLNVGGGILTYTFDLPDAALWSPESPNLHLFEVQLNGDKYDDDPIRVRYGIRQVEVSGQQILINGELIRLVGCNRHEFHPHFGHALPDAILASDLQQLHDLGVNFVRGSHYPQDERFLELCDEAGICVWCEGIGWQHTAQHLTDENFIQAQLNHLSEMVTMAVHHPSVIMWGILNESRSDLPESVPTYERLLTHLRTLDPSRPVTYASNHPFDDRCLHLVDIVSINTYPGWYFGSLETIPAEIDKIVAHLDTADGGCADKPLIISEIGAGAIPGWRDSHEVRWTEQYQAALLETVINHLFVTRDRFVGIAIWLFNDFRTPNQTSAVLGRPRGFNGKGLVDEYRRPKLGYQLVKQMFAALKRNVHV
jgi:beta-glucuronidase